MARVVSSFRVFAARFFIAVVIASVLTGGTVAGALWYAEGKVDDIPIIADGDADLVLTEAPEEPGSPANFLIVGSDTRSFVDTEQEAESFGSAEEQTGQRSDTIMVVHVDPASETGMVLSFPRDLWVDIPGRGQSKINAAFNDGTDVLIETIQQNFDIPIHHALEVDFAGFEQIVDAIGSVDIYFPAPARDLKTGLSVPLGGCIPLEGEQALAYVRSRFYEQWVATGEGEGDWQTDPRSDIGRIARQQYFIRTLAQTAVDKSSRNPFTAKRLLDETVSNLSKTESLGFDEIQRLVATFRDLDPSVVPMETVPATGGRAGSQSVLFVDEEAAEPILERMRTFSSTEEDNAEQGIPEPPDAVPSDVSVRVLNGSGVAGIATEAFDALAAQGFVTAGTPGDADSFDFESTEVRYASGSEDEAFLVLLALGGRGDLREVDALPLAEIEIVLGADYAGIEQVGQNAAGDSGDEAAGEEPASAAETPDTQADDTTSSTDTTVPIVLGEPQGSFPEPVGEGGLPLVGCPPGL